MSNNVTTLHNYYQDKNQTHLLSYASSSAGPSNQAIWTVECKVAGVTKGIGRGATKNEAKQAAAGEAIEVLGI